MVAVFRQRKNRYTAAVPILFLADADFIIAKNQIIDITAVKNHIFIFQQYTPPIAQNFQTYPIIDCSPKPSNRNEVFVKLLKMVLT